MLQSVDGVFSSPPIWSSGEIQMLPDGYRFLRGEFNMFSDRTCVGWTYFAIYDNNLLSTCMQQTGMTLHAYNWEEIPPLIQDELRRMKKVVDFYDTGKLINILLHERGFRCCTARLESLCHIGGISSASIVRYGLLKTQLSAFIPRPLLKLLRWSGLYNGWRDKLSREEWELSVENMSRKTRVCNHISAYLRHIMQGAPKPSAFLHNDSQLVTRVQETEKVLSRLPTRIPETSCHNLPEMVASPSES